MKLAHTIMSDRTCKCGKQIKQNLLNKKGTSAALLCYKCYRISTGKPANHVPRRKRLDAGLAVH